MTRRVRSLHRQVRGVLPEPAGRFPAGTPYAADDPELLLWILAALAQSNLLVHDRYVRPLSHDERDRYWQDFKVLGRLFGLRQREMPRDIDAFDAYMQPMLDGPGPVRHRPGPGAGDRDRPASAGPDSPRGRWWSWRTSSPSGCCPTRLRRAYRLQLGPGPPAGARSAAPSTPAGC